MADSTISALRQRFPSLQERPSADHPAFDCPADQLYELMRTLREEFQYDMLVDVTAIDWDAASPRFTGVYHVLSTTRHAYLRVAADVPNDFEPTLPSIASIYPAANWHERETYDMLGILYEGHPYMRRILMWDDYPYHPLRKEFPLAGLDADFPAPDVAAVAPDANVRSAPMAGGPFVAAKHGQMSESEPRGRDESWTETHSKPKR